MRELRFRAWHPYAKVMVKFDLPMIATGHLAAMCPLGRFDFDWDKTVVEQYIGLKDKEGHEIYEGDIVEGEETRGAICYGAFRLPVNGGEYLESAYGFYADVDEDYFESLYDDLLNGCIVIIGNIHSTPELAGGK